MTPPPALTLDLEARLLAPWLAACAAILGHAPRLIAGPGGPQLVFPADAGDTYRRAVANIRVMPHARVRAHVQRLGYAWDADGWITTTPTPLSLRARLRNCGITTSGYTPELHPIASIYMSNGHGWRDSAPASSRSPSAPAPTTPRSPCGADCPPRAASTTTCATTSTASSTT